ncbi:MAG: cytochrome c-type biogenesis protein CcmH [Deltaproteobacteria bacterium]|nr:cytochrome c-type biogenesis protein CcmH [Deltaproteobacteria bacterium]
MRPAVALLAAAMFVAPVRAAAAPGDAGSAPAGERALETRLLAPCCYKQTLDAHESPLARELRAEIHRRLTAGESAVAVEHDLIARYGERIVASSRDDPLPGISLALLAAAAAVAGGLVVLLRRWARRRAQAPAPEASPVTEARQKGGRDRYDEQIDAALRDLDD